MKTMMKIFVIIAFCASVGSVNAELLEMADGAFTGFKTQQGKTRANSDTPARLETFNQTTARVSEEGIERVEMADGQFAEFSMSEKNIQIEKRRKASEAALKQERQRAYEILREYCESIDVIEMADGNIAVFGKANENTAYDLKPLDCAYGIK